MRILVIGGTRFVGRRIVESLARHGHSTTLLNRGLSGESPAPSAAELVADRDDVAQLTAALAGASFDAVIDVCAYTSDQVELLAQALDGRGGRYTLISTISVYDVERVDGRIDEGAALLDPVTGRETRDGLDAGQLYGARKVACERAAVEHWGDPLIIRPGIVAGAFDQTRRFTHWVECMAHARDGDVVDAPGSPDQPMQVIDARDLGEYVTTATGRRLAGAFNATGYDAGRTLGQMLDAAIAAAQRDVTLNWISDDDLRARGDGESSNRFPLWVPADEPYTELFRIEPVVARATGLRCRPLVETAVDVLEHSDLVP